MNLSKQFTRREKGLLVVLAVLVVLGVYFLAVQQPVSQALTRLETERADAEMALTIQQTMLQRMNEMQAELDAILAQPNAAEIPTYDNLQPLMLFLNTILAPTSDYTLTFQALEMPEEDSIVRRAVDMSFLAPSYQDARTVVENLSGCPYLCQLGDLRVAPVSDGNSAAAPAVTDGPVQVSLSVTFFESLR